MCEAKRGDFRWGDRPQRQEEAEKVEEVDDVGGDAGAAAFSDCPGYSAGKFR